LIDLGHQSQTDALRKTLWATPLCDIIFNLNMETKYRTYFSQKDGKKKSKTLSIGINLSVKGVVTRKQLE